LEPIYWAQSALISMCLARKFCLSFMNPELWDCIVALLCTHSEPYVIPRRMVGSFQSLRVKTLFTDPIAKLKWLTTNSILDFRLSSCFECRMFSFGLFSGVWSLIANVSEHSVCSIFIGEWVRSTSYPLAECSETLAIKLHTPENNSKENIRLTKSMFKPPSQFSCITFYSK
jgi:hypothetical protein